MAFKLPAAIALIMATIFMLHDVKASEQRVHPLRRHITAAMPMDQLFQHGVLGIRQTSQTCAEATETLCPDGDGCCPNGEKCAHSTTGGSVIGICEGVCPIGAYTCTTPITACCPEVGMTCGPDGSCTATPGSVFASSKQSPQSSPQTPSSAPAPVTTSVSSSSHVATQPENPIVVSKTSDATSKAPATHSTTSPPATHLSSQAGKTSNGMSNGTKLGVGIGVGVGGFLLLLLLGAVLWIRRRKRPSYTRSQHPNNTTTIGEPAWIGYAELSDSTIQPKEATAEISELMSEGNEYNELPGSRPAAHELSASGR